MMSTLSSQSKGTLLVFDLPTSNGLNGHLTVIRFFCATLLVPKVYFINCLNAILWNVTLCVLLTVSEGFLPTGKAVTLHGLISPFCHWCGSDSQITGLIVCTRCNHWSVWPWMFFQLLSQPSCCSLPVWLTSGLQVSNRFRLLINFSSIPEQL